MAKDQARSCAQGLELKKIGNEILALLGGRAIHPINVRVGGFYRDAVAPRAAHAGRALQRARDTAQATVRLVAGFDFPDFERDYEFVALRRARRVSVQRGPRRVEQGPRHHPARVRGHFEELHVKRSNALHSHLGGRPYLTGPIARYSLNSDQLSPLAREAAKEAGLGPTCNNPFRSIIVRAVEVVYACDEALRIIERIRSRSHRISRSCRAPAWAMPAPRRRAACCTTAIGWTRRADLRCQDRAADLAEPDEHRGGPAGTLPRTGRHAGGSAANSLRTGGAQPRPVHLVRDPLPEARGRACLTTPVIARSEATRQSRWLSAPIPRLLRLRLAMTVGWSLSGSATPIEATMRWVG